MDGLKDVRQLFLGAAITVMGIGSIVGANVALTRFVDRPANGTPTVSTLNSATPAPGK
jgi:hypothetical protein